MNLVLDPESTSVKALAEKELLAENIRLLYVALTRAKNRCYLVWGPFREAGTSALAYILHPAEGVEGASPEVVAETENRFKELSDADMRGLLVNITEKAGGAISVYDMPARQTVEYTPSIPIAESLFCRTFTGMIDKDRRIASFSYLLHDRTALPSILPEEGEAILPELPDHDDGLTYEERLSPVEPVGILAFPRGAQAGNLLHDILEQMDFSTPAGEETGQIISESLNKFGFDLLWQPTVSSMIENVVNVPLHPDFGGLTLAKVKKEDRVSELEFYFPLNRLTREGLQKVLTKSGLSAHQAFPANMGKLQFQPVRGFMKGFMDLVFCHEGQFFLVDWKSNYLGANISDYGTEALTVAMQEAFYILQYHLYCAALNRYLKTRQLDYDYERHFGGVFYVFLRGVEIGNGGQTGIFYDRPAKATIDFLCESLITGG